MNHVHPVFAGLLQTIVAAPALIDRAGYENKLRKHDWQHEYSESCDIARRGREELAALRSQQRRIDPNFVIWNTIAPPPARDGKPA